MTKQNYRNPDFSLPDLVNRNKDNLSLLIEDSNDYRIRLVDNEEQVYQKISEDKIIENLI